MEIIDLPIFEPLPFSEEKSVFDWNEVEAFVHARYNVLDIDNF